MPKGHQLGVRFEPWLLKLLKDRAARENRGNLSATIKDILERALSPSLQAAGPALAGNSATLSGVSTDTTGKEDEMREQLRKLTAVAEEQLRELRVIQADVARMRATQTELRDAQMVMREDLDRLAPRENEHRAS